MTENSRIGGFSDFVIRPSFDISHSGFVIL